MIRRLLDLIDGRVTRLLDRHLTQAGLHPQRRPDLRFAHPNRPVAVDALTRWRETRTINGVWSCCPCCVSGCADIHRDACDVHQTGPVTA